MNDIYIWVLLRGNGSIIYILIDVGIFVVYLNVIDLELYEIVREI